MTHQPHRANMYRKSKIFEHCKLAIIPFRIFMLFRREHINYYTNIYHVGRVMLNTLCGERVTCYHGCQPQRTKKRDRADEKA